jgi:exosortase
VWHNSHGVLVPFMVAYLVRATLRDDTSREEEASAWGFLFLGAGLLLVVVDCAIKTQLLAAFGLILCFPGLSLLLLGARRSRRLVFPLVLAFFMLPIPATFAEPIMLVLRRISAAGTAPLISLLGIPVLREDTILHLPNSALSIADACSGFSTLYASVTVGSLLAYLAQSRRRGLAVLALAPLFAVACNIARCTALALMAELWGIAVLNTWWHPFTGVASFMVSISLLTLVAGSAPQERIAA